MELDDYLENRLFETCEAHGIEPSFAWVNGSEFSFVMHCRRIAYMSSGKNGKNGFAVPVISGEGNCLAPHFNFRIHTIFKLDKGGLVDTIEVASCQDFINQDSQWKMIRITGTDEEIRKIIDDVMSDIDRRLSYLEKLS